MLSPSSNQRIFLAIEPVDMRGGFDRLAGRVRAAGPTRVPLRRGSTREKFPPDRNAMR